MLDSIRRNVLSFLRVPPEPHVPEGTPGSARTFRAGRNFYRWQVLIWALPHLGVIVPLTLAYFVAWRGIRRAPSWVQSIYSGAGVVGLLCAAVVLLVTFLALKWSFELRWYIVTDRSLRIRRGVWNVEELTMTFANIQEIRLTAGPIQKLLGLADVEVHSAGGGSSGPHGRGSSHTAFFQGVENAVEIRDLLVERLRAYRDLGLGSGAEVQETQVGTATATVTAAGAVLEEVRALRHVLLTE